MATSGDFLVATDSQSCGTSHDRATDQSAMASETEFCGQSAVAIGDVATYLWRASYVCSCLRQRSACDWEVLMGQSVEPEHTFSQLDSRLCQHCLKEARYNASHQ